MTMKPPAPHARPRRWIAASLTFALGLGGVAPLPGQRTGGSSDDGPSPGFGSNIQRAPRAPVYFPPVPPPLDRPVARVIGPPGRNAAPPELAAYVCEFFYPQLASRLHADTMGERHRRDLAAYHAAKSALQQELKRELERQRDAEPPVRQKALEALARRQAPGLAQLEKTAEQLRRDLAEADRDWSDFREWRLNDKQERGYSPFEIAQVMRAYAYFQAGLLPAQRRLLLEIALELAAAVDDPAKAASTQPYFFFSPEPVRLILPDDLPAEVAAMVAAYQAKKSALKKQLYDTVYAHDGSSLAFFRNTLKSLAEKQARPLAELETRAEEIRRRMILQPFTARPSERTPFAPALHARIARLLSDRIEAQRDASSRVEAILARGRENSIRGNYRFDDDGLKFVVLPMRSARGQPPTPEGTKSAADANAALTAVADDYGRRLAELFNERDAIRREAASALGTKTDAALTAAMATATRVIQQHENESAYADYRVAVFEPGLSIEQRRLYFDAAVQRLELPLPRGEMQPWRRANTW